MADSNRLVSWKRIARYLQRGERTVRRWAAEGGMPVHRVSSGPNSSVYAYQAEIDAWLAARETQNKQAQSAVRPVVAVLPVDNLGVDDIPEPIPDGLTEEIISVLGQFSDLGIIARTSVMPYKATRLSIAEIGKQLNAEYVIEGSMRTERNRARVTMQLISVADQTHLWAENYDHAFDSPMALQRDVARQVAGDVARVITGRRPQQRSSGPVITGAAAEAYYHGRALLKELSESSLRQSIAAFDRAIALEPEFGPAYGGKAEALQLLTNFSQTSPADVMPTAMLAMNSAIAFSPDSAEVFASLGYLHSTYTREWSAAERAFHQSLELNRSLSTAHQWYAEMLAVLGRFDEAIHHAQEAKRFDPLAIAVDATMGHVLWLSRRYDELLSLTERVIDKEPGFALGHILRFSAHYELGDYGRAYESSVAAIEATGDAMPFVMFGKLSQGMTGNTAPIVEFLEAMKQQAEHTFVSEFFFGMLNTGLGEIDSAIDHLERACDEGVWMVIMLGQCAMFDSLRSSNRFDDLLKRIGLYPSRFRD